MLMASPVGYMCARPGNKDLGVPHVPPYVGVAWALTTMVGTRARNVWGPDIRFSYFHLHYTVSLPFCYHH
jgi:hypothetical protein